MRNATRRWVIGAGVALLVLAISAAEASAQRPTVRGTMPARPAAPPATGFYPRSYFQQFPPYYIPSSPALPVNPNYWVAPGLTLSFLQALESGVPYGAQNSNGVDPRPYVTNPGNVYLTPPTSTTTAYYFTPRDAFHTEGQIRTDLAVNYVYRLPRAGRAQLFAQAQLLNVFNQFQLCACGSTVFGTGSAANAGGVNLQRIDTTVLTPGTTSSRFASEQWWRQIEGCVLVKKFYNLRFLRVLNSMLLFMSEIVFHHLAELR